MSGPFPADGCGAEITYCRPTGSPQQQGWQVFECLFVPGHEGPHSDGEGFTWTDPWARVPAVQS